MFLIAFHCIDHLTIAFLRLTASINFIIQAIIITILYMSFKNKMDNYFLIAVRSCIQLNPESHGTQKSSLFVFLSLFNVSCLIVLAFIHPCIHPYCKLVSS